MRRVGDTAWRGFAMQKDAAKAFGVSQGDVSLLVNHPTKCPARLRQYEARRPVDSDAEEEESDDAAEAPAPANGGQNKSACEIRRVGAKKWRRFASRADAARAYTDLTDTYISRLISKKPSSLAPQHIRDKYEARNAVDESDSDSESDSGSEEAPAPAADDAEESVSGRDDAAAEAPAYKVGDRVKARYRGAWGAMYEGTIKAVKAGGDGLLYAVDFDDGDYDGSVKPCHIKALRAAAPRPAPAPAPHGGPDEDSDSAGAVADAGAPAGEAATLRREAGGARARRSGQEGPGGEPRHAGRLDRRGPHRAGAHHRRVAPVAAGPP